MQKLIAKISALLFIAVLLVIPLACAVNYGEDLENDIYLLGQHFSGGNLLYLSENILKSAMPQKDKMNAANTNLLLATGRLEHNGILIAEGKLLENIQEPEMDLVIKNEDSIKEFVASFDKPTYFMLVPTSVAINQKYLHSPNIPLFNQKLFIERSYDRLAGVVSAVEVYNTLFEHSDEYIYYNTESNLTGLGGYYIYTALAARLGNNVRGISSFSIQHLSGKYYGNIYEKFPYEGAAADTVTLYRYTKNSREYRLTTYNSGEKKIYYSIFPFSAGQTGTKIDTLLGGQNERIDVVATYGSSSILIFADNTSLSYLPFLVNDYNNVTVINLETISPESLKKIDLNKYSQVLFAYSVKTFTTSGSLAKLEYLTDELSLI